VQLARRYASVRPAMIVLGGSSMHKGVSGWQAGRAIACLPALTGNVGIPGGGFGPRHGSAAHGRGLASIAEPGRRRQAPLVPNQMSAITAALQAGRIRTLFLMGTNMLSSYADAGAVAEGLEKTALVVSYDLFLNDTARRYADIVLPGTAWLEELGCKMTHTHLYLMERALDPPGETRSVYRLMTELAGRLGIEGFHPWTSEEDMVNAVLDHPCTGHACRTWPTRRWTSTPRRARSSFTRSRRCAWGCLRCRRGRREATRIPHIPCGSRMVAP
jgi:anaerobic selenocysteine-containing dehydrogenase